jgi:hypothetical protein
MHPLAFLRKLALEDKLSQVLVVVFTVALYVCMCMCVCAAAIVAVPDSGIVVAAIFSVVAAATAAAHFNKTRTQRCFG